MLNKEARRREWSLIDTSTQLEALVVDSRGRSQSRKPHKSDKSESCSKSRSKSKSKKDFNCYHSGKAGHIKRHCRYLKRESQGKEMKTKISKMTKILLLLHMIMCLLCIMKIL